MSSPVIRVEGLWKQYSIGGPQSLSRSFREMLGGALSSPLSRLRRLRGHVSEEEQIWALRDLNLEVAEGEVVGIIGRNGAGKSTLLKVLSRITAPTRGRVTIRGRVASLLEVGTGFHPELSGRENIFLNGAILGMTRREVGQKFDSIVDFAEIAQFLDTPVKRYSSGMYVRLAFAVAAHLDPEILVVDEVLAVGDAAFQKKCLGKMGDIAGHGRTVLFVSHNMQAVQSLCSAAILIDKGRVVLEETPGRVVARYLGDSLESSALSWESPAGIGDSSLRLTKVEVLTGAGIPAKGTLQSRDDITIRLVVDLARPIPGLCVGFDLLGRDNATLLRTYDTDTAPESFRPLTEGTNILRCTLRGGLLNGGRYRVAPRIGIHNQKWIVTSDPLIEFDVVLDHGMSPYWNVLDGSNRPGMIAPLLTWSRPDA